MVVIVQGQFVTVSMVASVAVYSSSSYVTNVALGHQVVKLSTTWKPMVVALEWTRVWPRPVSVVFEAIDVAPTLAALTRLQSDSLIDSAAVECVRFYLFVLSEPVGGCQVAVCPTQGGDSPVISSGVQAFARQ